MDFKFKIGFFFMVNHNRNQIKSVVDLFFTRQMITTQVDRLKTVRKKRILKPCLVQESDISAKVRQLFVLF